MIFLKLIFLIIVLTLIQQTSCFKISIIVPVYNTGPFLERSLNSITNQTLEDVEIICINDGSTDNSQEILEEFEKKDERIKLISMKKNQGLVNARNIGLEIATGEFIGFVDSDDYIDNRYYENLYKYSEGYDIVKGIFVKSLNGVSGYAHYVNKTNIDGFVWDSIFRKSFLDQYNLKFMNDKKVFEDLRFRKDCYAHNPKIFYIPDEGIYYYYIEREGSAWKKSKKRLNKLYNEIMNNSKKDKAKENKPKKKVKLINVIKKKIKKVIKKKI